MKLRRSGAALLAALTLGSVGVAHGTPQSLRPASASVPAGSLFVPMSPTRVLDTRDGTGTGGAIAPLGPSGFLRLDLSTKVPAGTAAVVLNLTGTNPTAATFVSATPDSSSQSTVSNLNLVAHETRANAATVAVDSDRAVVLQNFHGTVDLVADLAGYYVPAAGAGFTATSPTRVLDTRDGTGTGVTAPVAQNSAIVLDLSGRVPAAATAVTLNLTGVDATGGTFVTVWPDGTPRPTASSVNPVAGQAVPNLITVALGANHRIDLYNFHGTVDLVADLAGYYATGLGNPYYRLEPHRTLDTRNVNGQSVNPIGPGGVRAVDLSAWLPTNAAAAVFNLTGTNTTASTFVTAWPAGNPQPLASNLNLVPGQTAANLATVALGAGGQLDVGNFRGNVDVIVDLAGYFAPPATPCAGDCVLTWGNNEFGRVGNGTTGGDSPSPAQVPGLSGVSAIASGFADTYALDPNGTVFAWGRNELQELGNGHADGNLPVPVPVVGLPKITEIAAGSSGGYAVDTAQHAWAWGDNGVGELGNGTANATAVPVQVHLSGPVTTVVSGGSAAYALLADGTVWAWGGNQFGVLGNGTIGTCGTGSASACFAVTPVRVTGLTNVVALYGGANNGFAVKSDGTVWAWGWNAEGELGVGTAGGDACYSNVSGSNCASLVPIQVTALAGVTKIVAGQTGLAVKSDGTVLAWGDNGFELIGNGTFPAGSCTTTPPAQNCFYPTPVAVPGLSNVTDITGGIFSAAAVKSDGTLWSWGLLSFGPATQVPTQVPGLSTVTKVATGWYHMAALATTP
jgi:alpha-tubulin suppressor-like RCC1 family protein